MKLKKMSGIIMILTSSNAFSADHLSFSLGLDFLSGDYGTTATTDITALTFSSKYKKDRWTLQGSIPYLKMSGGGVTVNGTPVVSSNNSEKGLGDLSLSFSYLSFYDAAAGYGFSTKAKVKLPVADEKKGLGTGKTDYSLEIDPFAIVGEFTFFSTLGYKFYGDTSTTNYNDVWYASLGALKKVDKSISIGAGYNFRENITATSENKKNLFLFLTNKLENKDSLQLNVSKGFSNATPDWGVGFTYKNNLY